MGLSGKPGVGRNFAFFRGGGPGKSERAGSGSTATVMFLTVRMVRLSRGLKISLYW